MRKRLQDCLALQADQRPDACAVVFNREATNYQELEQASNRLARALKVAGCNRGDRVALLLPKSPRALIGMFGSLKADCIYVPLDTTSPAARLVRILRSCESRCVLAEQSTSALLSEIIGQGGIEGSARIGWMDEGEPTGGNFCWRDIRGMSDSPVDSQNDETSPVHILFTSGSTGVPKGVVITQSNIIHFIDWAVKYFGFNPSDRISGHPPLHFDLSTFDVYGTVAAGAQIHLLPPELSLLPHRLASFMRDSELTQWFSVPSVLNQMAKVNAVRWNDFPTLRRLLWCGEKFPTPALIHWMRRLPHVSFVNLYGPTEATIASSYYRVPRCPQDDTEEIPIGEPCEGEQLRVLDDQLRPVPPGEAGDLYISGVGLSPGYWRDPETTKRVFLTDPQGSAASDRIYKTGDLARVGENGLIYILGRSDSQIKSRGYRIELGEIETAVHALPGIQEAAVVAFDGGGFEGAAIGCAYVPSADHELSPLSLKKQLASVLPHYMVPACWMPLQHMPRNGNGKTDRPKLKEQFLQQAALTRSVAQEQVA